MSFQYLTPVQIRQAYETAVGSALTGYRISLFPYDLFGEASRPQDHRTYSVGISASELYVTTDRQRRPNGVPIVTDVFVAFSLRMRADNLQADYDTALGVEADVIKACAGVTSNGFISSTFVRAERSVLPEGILYRGDITWRCVSRLALED